MMTSTSFTAILSQGQPDIWHSNFLAWKNVVSGPGRKACEFISGRVAAYLLRLLRQLVKTPVLCLVFGRLPLDLKYASLTRFRHQRD